MDYFIQLVNSVCEVIEESLLSLSLRIHPVHILSFVVVGFLVYKFRTRKAEAKISFWGWLFPKEMYLHPSHIVDLQLFVVGRFFVAFAVLTSFITPVIFALITIAILQRIFGESGFAQEHLSYLGILGVSFLLVLADDFCTYWVHRIHHQSRVLWPFHSVHHSAEIMTPITVYRKHPVYDFISLLAKNPISGIAQGFILYFLTKNIEVALLAGTNIFLVLSNGVMGNFRHSHVWISFGRFWEHLLISPAQHQIHHSIAVEHHDKNYGEIFAIWDWMFGTLYIPKGEEKLQFGLANAKGIPMKQPHTNLTNALWEPMTSSFKSIKKAVGNEFKGKQRTSK